MIWNGRGHALGVKGSGGQPFLRTAGRSRAVPTFGTKAGDPPPCGERPSPRLARVAFVWSASGDPPSPLMTPSSPTDSISTPAQRRHPSVDHPHGPRMISAPSRAGRARHELPAPPGHGEKVDGGAQQLMFRRPPSAGPRAGRQPARGLTPAHSAFSRPRSRGKTESGRPVIQSDAGMGQKHAPAPGRVGPGGSGGQAGSRSLGSGCRLRGAAPEGRSFASV